ncbi:probable DNA-directed RNA polymerase subunit delta [Palaemon carinicauda]|uniref:probable DNA-directed RNA polymerase subunit delta n=1 Tax=Palaemon carinicauda TaxID=392227 RepID=UPI0035B60431
MGTKLVTVLDENCKLKTELLIKKDVVCDLEMAEEELEKLWKEFAGVKAENRRLKRDLSEERAAKNMLVKADEKNKKLEEEIRNINSVTDEFAIYKEKYQDMMERNMKLEMELNHKNYAISQLVDGLSQTHPELKELYHMEISAEETFQDELEEEIYLPAEGMFHEELEDDEFLPAEETFQDELEDEINLPVEEKVQDELEDEIDFPVEEQLNEQGLPQRGEEEVVEEEKEEKEEEEKVSYS